MLIVNIGGLSPRARNGAGTGSAARKKQQRPAFANVALNDAQILLSGSGAPGSRPVPNGQQQEQGGWSRVVLEISDLPGFIADLKRAGLHFRNERQTRPGGRHIQIEGSGREPSGTVRRQAEAAPSRSHLLSGGDKIALCSLSRC
jgi:hypothetical protein